MGGIAALVLVLATMVGTTWRASAQAAAGLALSNLSIRGNSLTVNWVGGIGPYLVSTKASLAESNWTDVMTTEDQKAIVACAGGSWFVRLTSQAGVVATPYTAYLSGGSEIPPVTTTGSGLAIVALEGDTLTYRITFSGLSGPPTKVDIRGPATSTNQYVSVIKDLGPLDSDNSGTLTGVIDLTTWTAAQVSALKSAMTFVQIQTALNPGGELRGQIAPVIFSAPLSGGGEVPPVSTPGSGTVHFALIGNELNCTLTWTNLVGSAVTSHIHAPAPPTGTAGVLIPLFGVSGSSGAVSGQIPVAPAMLGSLIDAVNAGLAYVNIHSTTNLAGEIRGQIVP